MDTISLETGKREEGVSAAQLRKQDTVPCVVYGFEVENTSLQCDHNTLLKAYMKAGENTVVELDAAGKKVPVLFHSIDFHPVTEKILHVDFYAVNMKQDIEANIPVNFTGEAPAVKDLGGVLVTVLDNITVRCLPADLPHSIEVDISSLENFGDTIVVANDTIPDKVTLVTEEDATLATAQEPRRAAEPDPADGEEGEEGTEDSDNVVTGDGDENADSDKEG